MASATKKTNKGIWSMYQWGLDYHYPDHFVESQWTANKIVYLVYRYTTYIILYTFMFRKFRSAALLVYMHMMGYKDYFDICLDF